MATKADSPPRRADSATPCEMTKPADDSKEVAAIAAGDFEALLGSAEEQRLEAKRFAAYQLETVVGQLDLVKDAVAMANGGGGLLILGLATEKDASGPDVVRALDLVSESAFPWPRIASVVRDYTMPRLRVEVAWQPSRLDRSVGAVVIRVPSYREAAGKHIIIAPSLTGERAGGFMFGYAERDVSGTVVWDAERAASILRSGTSSTAQRLQALESQVLSVLEITRETRELVRQVLAAMAAHQAPSSKPAPESLDSRIDDTLGNE